MVEGLNIDAEHIVTFYIFFFFRPRLSVMNWITWAVLLLYPVTGNNNHNLTNKQVKKMYLNATPSINNDNNFSRYYKSNLKRLTKRII